jgi:hypothetical protein
MVVRCIAACRILSVLLLSATAAGLPSLASAGIDVRCQKQK